MTGSNLTTTSTDTRIDVDAEPPYVPPYTIPTQQNSVISLERQENGDASSPIHYFKGTTSISGDFYFEITLKDKPSAVWLGFVTGNWPNVDFEQNVTCSYELLTGSLKFENMLYVNDPHGLTADGDITIGFGVTRLGINKDNKDNKGNAEVEEEYWSVVYMKNDGEGKEIVRKGRLPDGLYPAIRLVQSSPDLEIKTTDFTHQNRQPFHLPHHAPIGLYECSPDRHYAASFSGNDGILSLWRLDSRQIPEFVQCISVPDFKIDPEQVHNSSLGYPHDQFSLAISNTRDNQLPHVVLARYHVSLISEDCKVIFLRINTKNSFTRLDNAKTIVGRPRDIVGHVRILDDGRTLLILGSERLFMVNMESRSLTHTFDRKKLNVKAFKVRSELVADVKPPLKPLGQDHFLWHSSPDYTTMWNVWTRSLVQTFRYTFNVNDKYDYDASNNLIAFYGTGGLKIFTTQTGISICEADRLKMDNMKVIGAKFVTINGDLLLMTMDGDNTKYTLRVWNPLTAMKVKDISGKHPLSEEFKYSDIAIFSTGHEFKNSDHASNERDLKTLDDAGTEHELKNPDDATKITRSSSISFVTPLKATIARLFISDLNDLLPSSVIETPPKKTLPKTLEFKEPPAIIPYQGQPKRSLKVVRKDQSQECQVEILGVNKRRAAVIFRPEPWNGKSLACEWISIDRFVVAGQRTVQIINATGSTDMKPVIEFVWCLPSAEATFIKIELQGDEPFQKLKLKYKLNGNRRTETVDTLKLSISPKHASRYIQYAGETYQSRTRQVYVKSLKEVIESSNNKKFLMNEVEPETRTSTLGHVIRDPSTEAVERVRTVLKANAYRPLFYDSELWDASALTEALSVGNFEMVEDIVKYCLQKDISKNNGTLLELGYLAIVIGALPTIARKKPMLAVYIAQYTSHIQLDRFISNFPEIDIDTKKSADGVIARVEELPKDVLSPFVSWVLDPLRPLERWWAKPQKSLDSWWDEQREPHPIRMCVSPLYGLNRYPPVPSRFPGDHDVRLSVFAQLAFRQSPLFDEPAFRAVVDYKWNAFARGYHNCLLFLYTSYALIYLIAVSISPYTLMIPGVKIPLIVLTAFFLIVLDIRPLLKRWKSLTYWSSIYHWIDRAAFVLVFVSTILTSPDYTQSIDLQAWTVVVLWLFVIFNFRVFRGLGLFFTLLIQILKRLGWLAVLMTAIIFAFSHSMWVLLRNAPSPDPTKPFDNPFSNMDGSLKSLWQFLGGDFNTIDNWNAGRSTDIMRMFFTFITTIVLLNVLIALLNNVYTDTQEIARKTWIRNRAEFIATVEVFMLSAKQRQDKSWLPAIVFYAVTPDKFREYEQKVKSIHPWIKSEDKAQSVDTSATQI